MLHRAGELHSSETASNLIGKYIKTHAVVTGSTSTLLMEVISCACAFCVCVCVFKEGC